MSKLSLEVAALVRSGEVTRARFDNAAAGHETLLCCLEGQAPSKVILEATGSYHQRLQAAPQAQARQVTVLKARRYAKSLNRRNKTDEVDALVLAQYGRQRRPAARPASAPVQQTLARLQRIPGVGLLTASLLLAELGDVERFASARSLVAYAGLTRERCESGTSVHGQRSISRKGSSRLRHTLYMPALAGLRGHPLLRDFCDRLVTRGKHKQAALAACMAKPLRITYGVSHAGRPCHPARALDEQHSI